MTKPFISVEDLVEYYNSPKFSVYALIFKPKMKGCFKGLLVLYIMASILIIVSLIQSVHYNNYLWKIGIVIGAILYFFIFFVLSYLQKYVRSKYFNNKTITRLRFEAFWNYCKEKKLSKSNLEKIRDILIREETKAHKDFSVVLPGAVVLLPLWNTLWNTSLNKLFNSVQDIKSLPNLLVALTIVIVVLYGIIWKANKTFYDNIVIRRYNKLKSTVTAIEELLLNNYQ